MHDRLDTDATGLDIAKNPGDRQSVWFIPEHDRSLNEDVANYQAKRVCLIKNENAASS
jgi:hypothetical protein